jgi:hypothetical protein
VSQQERISWLPFIVAAAGIGALFFGQVALFAVCSAVAAGGYWALTGSGEKLKGRPGGEPGRPLP